MESNVETNVEVTITLEPSELLGLALGGEMRLRPQGEEVEALILTTEMFERSDIPRCVVPRESIEDLLDGERDVLHWESGRAGNAEKPIVHVEIDRPYDRL